MNLGLKDKVVLVAGASQGLGKAAALALAQEEARVALCSRTAKGASAAAKEIAAKCGVPTLAHAADVSREMDCRRWVNAVAKKWGRIDILVANAGGPEPGTFSEVGDDDWTEGFEKNFMSAVRLARLVIPEMKKRKWGRIIFIASTSAKQPIPGLAISNALRAGILGLSKTLSQELGPFNILVNTVCPGHTATERLQELAEYTAKKKNISVKAVHAEWESHIPVKRLGQPDEIASAVTFLASEKASYITGVALQVDGGRTASPF